MSLSRNRSAPSVDPRRHRNPRRFARMPKNLDETLEQKIDRLVAALERLAPRAPAAPDFDAADCFVWSDEPGELVPVPRVNRVDISLIKGVDRVRDILVENT